MCKVYTMKDILRSVLLCVQQNKLWREAVVITSYCDRTRVGTCQLLVGTSPAICLVLVGDTPPPSTSISCQHAVGWWCKNERTKLHLMLPWHCLLLPNWKRFNHVTGVLGFLWQLYFFTIEFLVNPRSSHNVMISLPVTQLEVTGQCCRTPLG